MMILIMSKESMRLDSNSSLASLISIPYYWPEEEHMFFDSLWPNKSRGTGWILWGNFPQNQITWVLATPFPFFSVLLVRVFISLFKNSIGLGFSWGVVLLGLVSSNEMILVSMPISGRELANWKGSSIGNCTWPMGELSGNVPWKILRKLRMWLTKTS